MRKSHFFNSSLKYDAVLIWGEAPRITTGADILGKLLKGIKVENPAAL